MYQNTKNNNSFIYAQSQTKNKFLMRSKIINDLEASKKSNNTFVTNNEYKLPSFITSDFAQKGYFQPIEHVNLKLEEYKFNNSNYINANRFSNESSLNSSSNNNNQKIDKKKLLNHKHTSTSILSDYNNNIVYSVGDNKDNNNKNKNIMVNNFCTLRINKIFNGNNDNKFIRNRGSSEEKNFNYNINNNNLNNNIINNINNNSNCINNINLLSPKNNLQKILPTNPTSPKLLDLKKKDSFSSLKSFSNNSNNKEMKDEYIEFLQKKYQDNFDMNKKLENNIKELNKRCNNLINDNKLLNETLNERTTKLNELIQENEKYKKEKKNNQYFYESKIELYKKENIEKNNIIKNLKEEINNLKHSLLIELEKSKDYENNIKRHEIEFQNKLEKEKIKIKNDYKNIFSLSNNDNNNSKESNNNNELNYYENEIELIKKQSNIYLTNLKSKEKSIELITKENEKLLSENIIYRTQIEQYSNKISELYEVIKEKDKYIQSYKKKDNNYNSNNNGNIMENKYQITKINYYYYNKKNGKDININNSYNKLLTNNVFLSSIKKQKLNNEIKNNSFEIKPTIFSKNKEKKIPNMKKIVIDKKFKKQNEVKNLVNNKSIIKINEEKGNKIKEINMETIEKYISKNLENKENLNNNINTNNIMEKENKNKFRESFEIKKINPNDKNKTIKEEKKDNTIKDISNEFKDDEKKKINKIENNIKIEIDELNEAIKKMAKKKNLTYKPKVKKKFQILDGIDITEINTSSPVIQQNISFSSDKILDKTKLFLFGIDRKDTFHIFDIINKNWNSKKLLEIEDISETFVKNYQYEGTIFYNTLNGIFFLTGKKTDILYYYNSINDSMNKICKFNFGHDNGSLLLDKKNDRIFVFSGKNTKICEYYSFKNKKIYRIGDMITDRANASFVINDNKIYGFFGYCYKNNNYANSIEYIDYDKLDKWEEIKKEDLNFDSGDDIKNDIRFDIESVGTINFENEKNKIILYSGIQGDEEDFIVNYFYIFDTFNKSFNKVNKWITNKYKFYLKKWKKNRSNDKEVKGFHFAKNSNFLILPSDINIKDYPQNMAVLIDYSNNIHFIDEHQNIIDIYSADS